MPVRVVVLDFDGTLIDSNQLKYNAYFTIMPDMDSGLIEEVLGSMFEASRYDIIAEILRRGQKEYMGKGGEMLQAKVNELAREYNNIVLEGACTCSEIPGAIDILNFLHSKNIPAYVSSTTPEVFLREIVDGRGWNHFFAGVFGFPATKEETLLSIMKDHGAGPEEVLVVGDGESDRKSAEAFNTRFVPVKKGRFPVGEVMRLLAA